MSPLAVLLQALTASKLSDEPFHSAWESARGQALASACDEADWSAVLDDTRVGWQQAYTRAGHEHNRLANAVTARVSILAEGLEAVDVDTPTCGHCDSPIPVRRGNGRRAMYCGEKCRRAASAERSAMRVA